MVLLCDFMLGIDIEVMKVCVRGKENWLFHFKWKGQGSSNKVVDMVMVFQFWILLYLL